MLRECSETPWRGPPKFVLVHSLLLRCVAQAPRVLAAAQALLRLPLCRTSRIRASIAPSLPPLLQRLLFHCPRLKRRTQMPLSRTRSRPRRRSPRNWQLTLLHARSARPRASRETPARMQAPAATRHRLATARRREKPRLSRRARTTTSHVLVRLQRLLPSPSAALSRSRVVIQVLLRCWQRSLPPRALVRLRTLLLLQLRRARARLLPRLLLLRPSRVLALALRQASRPRRLLLRLLLLLVRARSRARSSRRVLP